MLIPMVGLAEGGCLGLDTLALVSWVLAITAEVCPRMAVEAEAQGRREVRAQPLEVVTAATG